MTERLSPEQLASRRDAVATLGSALRDLVDAAVRPEVPLAELEDVAESAQQLAARLRMDMRGLQEPTSLDDPETGERVYSPVYGPGNPIAPRLAATHTPDGRASGRLLTRLPRSRTTARLLHLRGSSAPPATMHNDTGHASRVRAG